MAPYYTLSAAWLSLLIWYVPEPDYYQIWAERAMRSNVLPYITGI